MGFRNGITSALWFQIIKNIIEGSPNDGAALALWRRRQNKAQQALARCLLGMKVWLPSFFGFLIANPSSF